MTTTKKLPRKSLAVLRQIERVRQVHAARSPMLSTEAPSQAIQHLSKLGLVEPVPEAEVVTGPGVKRRGALKLYRLSEAGRAYLQGLE